jgi:hypothetical protein
LITTLSVKFHQKITFTLHLFQTVVLKFGHTRINIDSVCQSTPPLATYPFGYIQVFANLLPHSNQNVHLKSNQWLTPLAGLETKAEPKEALKNYIAVKYELSKNNPESSRLYALEIMQGAPHLMNVLKGPLKKLVKQKVQVIETWIEQGKLKAVSPYHLIFHIWAVTQHYADFAVQTDAVVGKTLSNKKFTTEAKQTSFQLLVDSLIP